VVVKICGGEEHGPVQLNCSTNLRKDFRKLKTKRLRAFGCLKRSQGQLGPVPYIQPSSPVEVPRKEKRGDNLTRFLRLKWKKSM